MVSEERQYPCLSSILSRANVGPKPAYSSLCKIFNISAFTFGLIWFRLNLPTCLEISLLGPFKRYFLCVLATGQAPYLPVAM